MRIRSVKKNCLLIRVVHFLRLFSIQLKNPNRLKILPTFLWVHAQFKHDCATSENRTEKVVRKKSWKFSTFLADFLNWNFNSQSDFVLLSTTFFNMASNNEAPREIYAGFSDDVISNFLFQRQFYQPDGSQQQLPRQQHEIQAPTTTAGREQEDEFSGSPRQWDHQQRRRK